MEVKNYPLKERTAKDLAELERVQALRRFEMAVSKLDRLYIVANGAVIHLVHSLCLLIQSGFYLRKRSSIKFCFWFENARQDYWNNSLIYVVETPQIHSCFATFKLQHIEKVAEEEEEGQDAESAAVTGSFSAQLGYSNPYVYSQFSLRTTEQRINQILLLQVGTCQKTVVCGHVREAYHLFLSLSEHRM